jgi:hypothetical protein
MAGVSQRECAAMERTRTLRKPSCCGVFGRETDRVRLLLLLPSRLWLRRRPAAPDPPLLLSSPSPSSPTSMSASSRVRLRPLQRYTKHTHQHELSAEQQGPGEHNQAQGPH